MILKGGELDGERIISYRNGFFLTNKGNYVKIYKKPDNEVMYN